MLRRLMPFLAIALLASAVAAQNIISARAGYVNYSHGQVHLPTGHDGKAVKQLDEGQSISTDHGRAELLLTPGSYLRLDNDTEVKMVSSRLQDVQVELISGTASLEVNEVPKGSKMAVVWQDHSIPITQHGLYRFEPGVSSMRVYVESGKLEVPGMKGAIKAPRYVDINSEGTLSAAVKFNLKDLDEFDRFNGSRSYTLARASYRAANTLPNGYMSTFRNSIWYLDPLYGFYTFLPYSYSLYSPFGWMYYSPRYVYLNNPPVYSGSTGSRGSSGNTWNPRVGASGSAPPLASSGSSGSAPAPRVSAPAAPPSGGRGSVRIH